jgi:hypothetical protein
VKDKLKAFKTLNRYYQNDPLPHIIVRMLRVPNKTKQKIILIGKRRTLLTKADSSEFYQLLHRNPKSQKSME